jgi:hypothetical protein
MNAGLKGGFTGVVGWMISFQMVNEVLQTSLLLVSLVAAVVGLIKSLKRK